MGREEDVKQSLVLPRLGITMILVFFQSLGKYLIFKKTLCILSKSGS